MSSSYGSNDSLRGSTSDIAQVKSLPSYIFRPFAPSNESRLPREDDTGFTSSIVVNNDKVRYYYNKTLCLRQPIGEMLESLEKLHACVFAYPPQFPETGDYSVIGTLFELIPTISTMIDWGSLNHTCYWEDFCRESKQLFNLLDKVNGAAIKCCDTATDVLTQAVAIFSGAFEPRNYLPNIDRALAHRQSSDYINDDPGGQSIQIHWMKPGDVIDLQWYDADGGLVTISLNQTGLGFRIRFLRHIIYHARTCLESAYIGFLRLNVTLFLHIPIEKLARCQNVEVKRLSPQEKACVAKAKREFDANLSTIWNMISRYKFQTFQLFKYNSTFKGMRRSRNYIPNTTPTFMKVTINVNDSLLMRVISSGIQAQAKEESFDFTVFPDRTEDIIAKIEDLLVVSEEHKELQMLLALIKVVYDKEKGNMTSKEFYQMQDDIRLIFAHRLPIRRWLKKSIELFENHSAFHKMDKVRIMPTLRHICKKGQNSIFFDEELDSKGSSSLFKGSSGDRAKWLENEWVSLQGGIKVKFHEYRGIMTKFPSQTTVKWYNELIPDEKVTVTIRLIRQLLYFVANCQCSTKVSFEKISETKSLVKRLKAKDRLDNELQNLISEQQKYLIKMLKLTKAMRFLKN